MPGGLDPHPMPQKGALAPGRARLSGSVKGMSTPALIQASLPLMVGSYLPF